MGSMPRAVDGCTSPERGKALEAYLEKTLPPSDEESFEEHYFSCRACLDEIRMRQALPAALAAQAAAARRSRIPWVSMAAGLGALLLAYPAWLGVVELPEVRRLAARSVSDTARLEEGVRDLTTRIAEAEARHRAELSWQGPVGLTVFSSPLRGSDERRVMRLRRDQPHAVLAIVPPGLEELGPAASLEILVSSREGAALWSHRLSVKDARLAVAESGTVTFLVPSTVLPAGRHQLRVREDEAGDLLILPFDVIREP